MHTACSAVEDGMLVGEKDHFAPALVQSNNRKCHSKPSSLRPANITPFTSAKQMSYHCSKMLQTQSELLGGLKNGKE